MPSSICLELPNFCRKGKLPESVSPFPPKTMPDIQLIDRSDFILPELAEFKRMTFVGQSVEFDTLGQGFIPIGPKLHPNLKRRPDN